MRLYWTNIPIETNYSDKGLVLQDILEEDGISNPLMNSNVAKLVGWYGFNEGSGTSVTDLSGTGNTATLVNGTTFNTDTP